MAVALAQSSALNRTQPARVAAADQNAARINFELASTARYADLSASFRDLTSRAAEPNVFLEPAFVAATEKMEGGQISIVLAWDGQTDGRLLGVWAFVRSRIAGSLWPARVLRAPLHP